MVNQFPSAIKGRAIRYRPSHCWRHPTINSCIKNALRRAVQWNVRRFIRGTIILQVKAIVTPLHPISLLLHRVGCRVSTVGYRYTFFWGLFNWQSINPEKLFLHRQVQIENRGQRFAFAVVLCFCPYRTTLVVTCQIAAIFRIMILPAPRIRKSVSKRFEKALHHNFA